MSLEAANDSYVSLTTTIARRENDILFPRGENQYYFEIHNKNGDCTAMSRS